MTELYLVLETGYLLGVLRFLDGVLSHQNLIDTLHRSQSLGDVIPYLRHLLQGVDNRIEDHHIIYKGGTRQ